MWGGETGNPKNYNLKNKQRPSPRVTSQLVGAPRHPGFLLSAPFLVAWWGLAVLGGNLCGHTPRACSGKGLFSSLHFPIQR